MSRAVANTLLPAKRPASTIARPRPRELPVTNHTCAIQSSYLRSPSYFETARAAGTAVQQEITIARPAERREVRKRMSYFRFSDDSQSGPPILTLCVRLATVPDGKAERIIFSVGSGE